MKITTLAPIITIKPTRSPAGVMALPQKFHFLCGFMNLFTELFVCFIPVRAADGPADTFQMRDFLIHLLALDKNVSSVKHKEPTADAEAENPTESDESSQ